MDKLANEMTKLLAVLLAIHERLLVIATARQNAMRAFDMEALNRLLERERHELAGLESLERARLAIVAQFRQIMGKNAEPTVTQIAAGIGEPARTRLLVLSAHLKTAVEKLHRANRINSKVCQGVIKSISKVLKVITGMAQHAGLYMANGRKAAPSGVHLLDAVG
jgi:flagellar biosynthesis/type III secretory pathway chaperone